MTAVLFSSAAGLLCLAFAAAPDDALYQILKDCQTQNMGMFKEGSFNYAILYMYKENTRDVQYEGSCRWSGDDAFWNFRYFDPDKVQHRECLPGGLEAQPRFQCLKTKEKSYYFSTLNNFLGITTTRDGFAQDSYLEVGPRGFWSRCCVPTSGGGGARGRT